VWTERRTDGRTGLETDHSPLSSTEINNHWRCTPTPSYTFLAFSGTILPSLPLPVRRTNDRTSTVGIVINPFELTFEVLSVSKMFIYHRDFDEVFTGPSRLVAVVMGSELTAQ